MNFYIVEGSGYNNLEEIYPEFVEEYVFGELSNKEIRKKLGLTHREFKQLSDTAKTQYGISRRKKNFEHTAKYYYKHGYGYVIGKTIDKEFVYLGFVTDTEEVAKKVVELCKKASWNIDECKHIIHNYGDYLCSA